MQTIYLPASSTIQDTLMNRSTPFELLETNNSVVIKTENIRYVLNDENLTIFEMGFVRNVKRYAEKNPLIFPDVKANQIQCFKSADNLSTGLYYDIIEVDLNHAFWRMAYDLKIINQKIYEMGLNIYPDKKSKSEISKHGRLVALGSMATVKSISDFDGEEISHRETKTDEKTRNYFLTIAQKVNDIMLEIASEIGGGFIFYWVDAFFVKAMYKDKLIEAIRKRGFGCKVIEIACMRVSIKNGCKMAYVNEIKETCETYTTFKHRPFFIERNQEKTKNANIKLFSSVIKRLEKADIF